MSVADAIRNGLVALSTLSDESSSSIIDIFGPILLAAGRVVGNDEELIFNAGGALIPVEDAAGVTIDAGFKFEPYGSVTQFFDWTRQTVDSPIEITSSITQVINANGERSSKLNNQASNEVGGQLGGDVSADGKAAAISIGVKVEGNVSSKVTSKIEREVSTKLNVQISTTQSYSEKQNITLKAGKFTAITTSWQRRYVTGTVSLGAGAYAFDATVGYMTSRAAGEYAGVAALPPHLMAEYVKSPDNHEIAPLTLFWSPARKDNFTTGTTEGARDAAAANYANVRVEGSVFRTQMPNTVPLKLYWSGSRADNFTAATAQGDQAALVANYGLVRVEGYVYSAQQPNTVPLKLYWNPSLTDNFVTATWKGERDAQAAGYQYIRDEGYVIPAE